MPKAMTLKEAQTAYSLAIETSQLSQGPVFVEHEGRLVAVIMSIEDYQQRFLDEYDAWRTPNRKSRPAIRAALLLAHRSTVVRCVNAGCRILMLQLQLLQRPPIENEPLALYEAHALVEAGGTGQAFGVHSQHGAFHPGFLQGVQASQE